MKISLIKNLLLFEESYSDISSYYGMLWRFAPMADPLVKEWHSRDLGSRISEREVAAVVDWLSTNKNYHVMRDHPNHRDKISGCCFGMKLADDVLRTDSTLLTKQG